MAFAISYFFLYLIVILPRIGTVLNNNTNAKILMTTMTALTGYYIVFRELTYKDTSSYVNQLIAYRDTDFITAYKIYASNDFLFFVLQWSVSRLTNQPYVFLFIVYILFVALFQKFILKLFSPWHSLLILFSYTMFPFYYNLTTNIIRQGLAMSVLFLLLADYLNQKKTSFSKMILIIATATLIHWSALVFGLIILLLNLIKINMKFAVGLWLLLAMAYVLNLQTTFALKITYLFPKAEMYSSSLAFASYGNRVNRIDFLLFSAVWIGISLIIYNAKRDEVYGKLIKIYIIFNSVFLFVAFLPFSDRTATYSWMLIPLLIWMPILKATKYSSLKSVAISALFVVTAILTGTLTFYGF